VKFAQGTDSEMLCGDENCLPISVADVNDFEPGHLSYRIKFEASAKWEDEGLLEHVELV